MWGTVCLFTLFCQLMTSCVIDPIPTEWICVENRSESPVYYTLNLLDKEMTFFSDRDLQTWHFTKLQPNEIEKLPEVMYDYSLKYDNLHVLFISGETFENNDFEVIRKDRLWSEHVVIHSMAELKAINRTVIYNGKENTLKSTYKDR